MVSELHEDLFESLEPPRGGLDGMRARVARDTRRRVRRRRVQGVSAVAAVVALVGWFALAPGVSAPPSPELDVLRLGLGQLPTPAAPVTVPAGRRGEIAVQRVPVTSDRVVFYLVSSDPAGT